MKIQGVRCYSDDEFGAFWEKWVASLGESWFLPMTQQMEAMFPHRCDLPWMAKAPEARLLSGWVVVSQSFCLGNAAFSAVSDTLVQK